MAIVISGSGIDMGGNPVSNLANAGATDAVNKAYVDDLKIIATGTATFTAATNNINLTGIGIGVEIGDVIQISGAEDSKNNSEFTVEVITDGDNIIVNQAHANKGTSKNIANRVSDTGVTVKLLAKWYNAPLGLGQAVVNLISVRSGLVTYTNSTNRTIYVSAGFVGSAGGRILKVNDIEVSSFGGTNYTPNFPISPGSTYELSGSANIWVEVR